MLIYLVSLPIWNFVLPAYSFWKFDDFSWGDTRKTAGEKTKKAGIEYEGEFDSSKITMKRWAEFERDRRVRNAYWGSAENIVGGGSQLSPQGGGSGAGLGPYDGGYYSDA
jgi:chitin synthase